MGLTYPVLAGPGLLPRGRAEPLSFNNDEADANSPAKICISKPGTGKAIYLTHITISGRTGDIAITLRDAVAGAVLFGPIQCQGDGSSLFSKDWKHPLKLSDDKALFVYGSAASPFTIYGEYFIGQKPV